MATDLVRASRDGDQFHYHWAARQCLQLLGATTDLVEVSIEGPSEDEGEQHLAGEEVIDVGLYFGSSDVALARSVRYIQLKHSTHQLDVAWTASNLAKTLRGFAKRYRDLAEHFSEDDLKNRITFVLTTNRPLANSVREAITTLSGRPAPHHPDVEDLLVRYSTLEQPLAERFFRLLFIDDQEDDLWAQRNLLIQDVHFYLPQLDYDAPMRLKELVTRKATSEFSTAPSITRQDVLRALGVTESDLAPAPCLIADMPDALQREQQDTILHTLLEGPSPLIVHADGGMGKSILSARLAAAMPHHSEAILYDCFGNGSYRNSLHFRHRHRDALVQIANELAARGLCHPLIPSPRADSKHYMTAFAGRLSQASRTVQARHPDARLCIIIDAADNAELAATEMGEPFSFVRDLISLAPPAGVRLAFTCRTHRRSLLKPPAGVKEIELQPFRLDESANLLRSKYPDATGLEVEEFALLTSSNPRLQALALSWKFPLAEMLKTLGPEPTTVDEALRDQLERALRHLREGLGSLEQPQATIICQCLAVLRPQIPLSLVARLSATTEPAVRSFILDLGRPLLLQGDSIQFLDEPAETWFREQFRPDKVALGEFLGRLRPEAQYSAYAASVLPQLLLHDDRIDELIELALSHSALPEGPLDRRDVEIQRLLFALRACLEKNHHLAAAKMCLKAGGECAGQQRQVSLLQRNTDLAATLLARDRITELVSRRTFQSTWLGSHHVYDAALLASCDGFAAEAASSLRMADDWLWSWSSLPVEERQRASVTDADRAEISMAILRLRGAKPAARFLRGWTPKRCALTSGRLVARRLIDVGDIAALDALAVAAASDVWLTLGLAIEARLASRRLPSATVARTLRLLRDRRVRLPERDAWDLRWEVLDGVRAVIELALIILPKELPSWAVTLKRYLPDEPPPELEALYESDPAPLLRAYALHASLRGVKLNLLDVAPPKLRAQLQLEIRRQSGEAREFSSRMSGILPWFVLGAEMACGRVPTDVPATLEEMQTEAKAARSRGHSTIPVKFNPPLESLRLLHRAPGIGRDTLSTIAGKLLADLTALHAEQKIAFCHYLARIRGLEVHAIAAADSLRRELDASREDADTRSNLYAALARAVLAVSKAEAAAYLDLAIEVASRVGDENLDRWQALLELARAAGVPGKPRSQTAHRLARTAELTYEYVDRDKHFDWEGTIEALTRLAGPSVLAILSRWRDRAFGDSGRLLPLAVYRLEEAGLLAPSVPIALAGYVARWHRSSDISRVILSSGSHENRTTLVKIGYRYIRVISNKHATWTELQELASKHGIALPDIARLVALTTEPDAKHPVGEATSSPADQPLWDQVFYGVAITDSSSLRAAYDRSREGFRGSSERFFLEALTRASPGEQSGVVEAVASWPDYDVFFLCELVKALPSLPSQLSVDAAFRRAALLACERAPLQVRRTGWAAMSCFESLIARGTVSARQLSMATLKGYAAQMAQLDASAMFRIIEPLASLLAPDDADSALTFGLDLLEPAFRPDVDEGPWAPSFEAPNAPAQAIAGYVWAGLGSPSAADRWESAHSVRALVELGCREILEALVSFALSDNPMPFVDSRLEFYLWHARQWLLFGLARGALEKPETLRVATPLLQRWTAEKHVIIRTLAVAMLRHLTSGGDIDGSGAGATTVIARAASEVVYENWLDIDEDVDDSDISVGKDEMILFGYDISRYWFGSLGRAFGLPRTTIEKRVVRATREALRCRSTCGRQADARHTREIFRERETYHSHGSLPKVDDLAAYYAFHGMMVVAGELVEERGVRRHHESAVSDFQGWVSSYMLTRPDGKWLSDARGPRFVNDALVRTGHAEQEWRWGVTAAYLDEQIYADNGFFVLWARYSSGESDYTERTSIRSALVTRRGSESLVSALQTAPRLGRLVLPSANDEALNLSGLQLQGWVSLESATSGIDTSDPWASGVSYPCPTPGRDVIARLGLARDEDSSTWRDSNGGILRSEAWSHVQGYGQRSECVSSDRLTINRAFLLRLLADFPGTCLVVSVEIMRRAPRRPGEDEGWAGHFEPYVRYYLLGEDCVAHAL